MYRYDNFDAAFVAERGAHFRDQVARRLTGELTEDQSRPFAPRISIRLGKDGRTSAAGYCTLGKVIGPEFSIDTVVDTYPRVRKGHVGDFLAAHRRAGFAPFKEAYYERA